MSSIRPKFKHQSLAQNSNNFASEHDMQRILAQNGDFSEKFQSKSSFAQDALESRFGDANNLQN